MNENIEIPELYCEQPKAVTPKKYHYLRGLFADATKELLAEAKANSVPPYIPISNPGRRSISLVLTDTHFGKKTFDPTSNQVRLIFNFEMGRARINQCFDRLLEEVYVNPASYDEINIILLGDHIEGDGTVFHGQVNELEDNYFIQMQEFKKALWPNIKRCADVMRRVGGSVRIEGVPGNHGVDKSMKNPDTNYDMQIFRDLDSSLTMVRKEYNDLMNVSIEYSDITSRTHLLFDIKGWKVYLRHIFPENFTTTVGRGKTLIAADAMRGIDLLFTGHLHSESMATISRTTVIRPGSLCGYDEFASDITVPRSEAQQVIFVTTEQEKIRSYIPVVLEGIYS